MRRDGVWRGALVLGNVKILDVRQETDVVICRVEPPRRRGPRCGRCGRACPWYDPARGPRRWRALDVGCRRAWVEAKVGRVSCPERVVVERVPWAGHGSGFTRSFEEQVAWLAMECSKTAVENLDPDESPQQAQERPVPPNFLTCPRFGVRCSGLVSKRRTGMWEVLCPSKT